MCEILDIYDQNRNKTGKKIERREGIVLDSGEFIIAVQCWIVNTKGEILLTQRRLGKTGGGKWEPTGGLIIAGETSIEGVKRELNEEIGIIVSDKDIKILKTNREGNVIRDIYIINKDIDLEDISFNDKEVINAKYVTKKEFKTMIESEESFEWLEWFLAY